MARVALAPAAIEDLDRLILTHSLPPDTHERVQRSLRALARFPRMGVELGGRWSPLRSLLGPWRWLLLIYSYEEELDLVVVVTMQDARSSSAATSS